MRRRTFAAISSATRGFRGFHRAPLEADGQWEDVNFRTKRGLERSLFLQLSSGDWIRQHHTLLLVGAKGS